MSVATLREALDREYAVRALSGDPYPPDFHGTTSGPAFEFAELIAEHVHVGDYQRLPHSLFRTFVRAVFPHYPADQIDGRVRVLSVTEVALYVQLTGIVPDDTIQHASLHLFYDQYVPAVRCGDVGDAQ